MVESDDGVLLQAIAAHDPDALVLLYDRYGRLAFGLAYRVLGDAATAEEVVQDAFMSVWRRAASFDASKGNARSWLLSIVHNRAIDQLRGRYGRRRGEIDFDTLEPVLAGPDLWGEVVGGLRAEAVRAALSSLPEEQRRAIDLAYFEGLTHQEIAERTGTPLGTIKSRLRLGLRKLHDSLVASGSYRIDGDSDGR
ncbi:MAG TPA: sigma-70 family RNA polymerase sigma factor [Nitrolancea sp.]|nr:sigma-70 family RNA polymerase sigma factor [Nitrolancea sp.]